MVTDLSRATRAQQLLESLGFGDAGSVTPSTLAFPDGGAYRVEIPSVEGPRSLEAVFVEADRLGVPVHRVSSGSGISLTSTTDIAEMVAVCAERKVELSLFVGPRAAWDIGGQARQPGSPIGARHEGLAQVLHAMTDLMRADELGVRGALVADEGLLRAAEAMKSAGLLSPEMVLKISVQLMAPNAISATLLESLGAGTINVPPGLSMAHLSEIRRATTVPLDMYVEAPDTLGGFVRLHDIPDFVHVLAPVYLKFGLRNHADVYPSGYQFEELNVRLSRERVRRAQIGLELLAESGRAGTMSAIGSRGVAVPVRPTSA